MQTSKSLLLVIEAATRTRDDAAAQLMRGRQAQRVALEQMLQLEAYVAETQQRWAVRTQQRTAPELLRHHYQFLDKLHQAMSFQRVVLGEREQQVEAGMTALVEAERRLASLSRFREKRAAEAARIEQKKEQKQTDEMAMLLRRSARHHPLLGHTA